MHRLIIASALLTACADEVPSRELAIETSVEADGFSAPVTFTVPENTRSITIVVEGSPDAVYGLGSFAMSDGTERVGLDLATAPGPAMRASYDTEQIGQMDGALFQTIRLGTFTHVYPYRPDQSVIDGKARLRIASDKPGPVKVAVLMPEEDGGKTLHLNLFVVSETLSLVQPPTFLDELQSVFSQVGISVVVDETRELRGTGLSRITQSTEPQESPVSMSAMLPGLAADPQSPMAIDVFIVDSLPFGIGGLSLGTPGPPVRSSYYYGVIIRNSTSETAMATVIAHEASHFLALQHVTNAGVSGMIYPDPLDDTEPSQGNLMQSGTVLTSDQGFALSRSALLQAQ